MLFNIKSALVFGLATIASAAPVALTEVDAEVATLHHLEARAALPEHGVKCGTQIFTKAQIQAAVSASKRQSGKYPELFKNHNSVFSNHPSPATNLWEYPLAVSTWTGGTPGKYRVVVNAKYAYVGAMIHTPGNMFDRCVDAPKPAAACPAPPKKTARNLWGLVDRATKKKSPKGDAAACALPAKKPSKPKPAKPTKPSKKKPTKKPAKPSKKKPAKKPAKKPKKTKSKGKKGGKF